MRKVIALMLVLACICSMAACSNNNNADTSTPPTNTESNMPGDTTPGNDSNTEEEAGFQWETKEVPQPMFDAPQEQTFVVTQLNGKDVTATVVESPLKIEDYDIEATKNALAEQALFMDWFFGIEKYERGLVTLYSDIGQQTAYDYYTAIVASRDFYDTQSYFTDMQVQYKGRTDKNVGYNSIRVEIDTEGLEMNAELQQKIYDALVVVYGEEYAKVLCYNPVQSENIVYEIQHGRSSITFRRNINKSSVVFNILVSTSSTGWFEGYAGTEYQPMLGTPEKFFEIFSEEIGSFELRAYKRLASEMLSQYYTDYECTVPDYTSGYNYRVVDMDNGYQYVSLSVDGMVKQKEVGKLVCPDLKVEYEFGMLDGVVTDIEGEFYCGVGLTGNNGDAETVKHALFAKALPMMEMIMAGDQELAKDFMYNESDKAYNTVKRTMEILGLEREVVFQFQFGETMADTYVGYLCVKF